MAAISAATPAMVPSSEGPERLRTHHALRGVGLPIPGALHDEGGLKLSPLLRKRSRRNLAFARTLGLLLLPVIQPLPRQMRPMRPPGRALRSCGVAIVGVVCYRRARRRARGRRGRRRHLGPAVGGHSGGGVWSSGRARGASQGGDRGRRRCRSGARPHSDSTVGGAVLCGLVRLRAQVGHQLPQCPRNTREIALFARTRELKLLTDLPQIRKDAPALGPELLLAGPQAMQLRSHAVHLLKDLQAAIEGHRPRSTRNNLGQLEEEHRQARCPRTLNNELGG
mmetsp:Transcript_83640/g.227266  ORF Transcript_83640/g.227266 Transcript_83640/m.227266 type:complete len:281 (+) Transcript_83640:259-1101(+)